MMVVQIVHVGHIGVGYRLEERVLDLDGLGPVVHVEFFVRGR